MEMPVEFFDTAWAAEISGETTVAHLASEHHQLHYLSSVNTLPDKSDGYVARPAP